MIKVKNALISVYEKRGIVEFARALRDLSIQIFATGGTAEHLHRAGIDAKWVSELTGTQEMLGGKIKTLHPDIFARILATDDEAEKLKIERIQLIVVNLYPPDIEPDIGGVSLIRAGLKAKERTAVVCSPDDYEIVALNLRTKGIIPDDLRDELNKKSATYVLKYQLENYIKYFNFPFFPFVFEKKMKLKYGTNPNREGFFSTQWGIPSDFEVLKGELSYNNIYDADSAVRCALATSRVTRKLCACVVKHGTPCGVAASDDPAEAIKRAWGADERSAYGGVLATSFPLTKYSAKELEGKFLEVIASPDFDSDAIDVLMKKKARVIRTGLDFPEDIVEIKNALGGFLIERYSDYQEDISKDDFKPAYEFDFSERDIMELMFSYTVVRFARSNAVCVSSGLRTLAVASGFTARVEAVEFAMMKAVNKLLKEGENRNDGGHKSIYVSSDGFFPFPDSIEIIKSEGEKAGVNEIFVAHPGGSIRDKEVIKISEELRVKLFTTGKRCFKH